MVIVAPCGHRVLVVRIDVMDVHVQHHGGQTDVDRAVDVVDVGVGMTDHHDARADPEPAQVLAVVLLARLAVLDELEHAGRDTSTAASSSRYARRG